MNKKETPEKIWKKIFDLLPQRQKMSFFLILVILGVSAVLSQLTPLAVGYLTDRVLAEPDVTFLSVVPVLLVILFVNVINEIIKVARRLIVEDTATQAEKNARQKAASSLLMAPLSYFRSHMTGNIHGRLNRSLDGTIKLIKLMFMDFAPAVTTGLAAIVTIFIQLPVPVACLVILVIPVGTFIVLRQIGTQKGIRVELMETKADMDGTMVELLGGIETIRALDGAQAESDRILARSEQLRRKEMRHHRAMAFYDCLKFINEAVFSVLVIGISVLLASRGQISIGTVLTAYLCFTQLTGPLRELHRILDEFSECVVLANDYFQILELPVDFSYLTEDIPVKVREENSADRRNKESRIFPDEIRSEHPADLAANSFRQLEIESSARLAEFSQHVPDETADIHNSDFSRHLKKELTAPSGHSRKNLSDPSSQLKKEASPSSQPQAGGIRLCSVNFSYPEKPEQRILKNISLSIPAGTFVGIAGPSGCGKSSLIKVIDRLEQAQGEIFLGGVELSAFSRRMLAENIALVPQTPFIIADTVYRNICYGMKQEVTLEEVREAAKKANIAADIEKLPGGYQFALSEGGANLSGGQRQRIALARIFLKKPRILILDEATSALDNTSEKLIQAQIEKMKEDCGTTVISIAHRLSTLQNCDEIIVIDKGEIVQKGTFQELRETLGIFRDMALGIVK